MSRGVCLLLWEPRLLRAHTAGLSFPPLLSHLLPKVPACLKKKRYISPGFQFTKEINLSPSNAPELVFATCMARPGSAEVQEHRETCVQTGQNDLTELQILCFLRVFEKLVVMGHFEHTWAIALFEKFCDLLGKKAKKWKCKFLTPLSD